MLKKVAAVAAATAGLMMISAPAFAGVPGGHHPGGKGGEKVSQIGLINVNNVDMLNDVSGALGLCGNDVSAVGVTVPILSPDGVGNCAASGVIDDGQHD